MREGNVFVTPKPTEGMNVTESKDPKSQNTGPVYREEGSMDSFGQIGLQICLS